MKKLNVNSLVLPTSAYTAVTLPWEMQKS